jgi:hypothetical protein
LQLELQIKRKHQNNKEIHGKSDATQPFAKKSKKGKRDKYRSIVEKKPSGRLNMQKRQRKEHT